MEQAVKPTKAAQAGVTIFFIALLLIPVLYKHFQHPLTSVLSKQKEDTALERYGFFLTESAKASGIQFHHQAPTLDPKLNHIMEQVASMGAAVSVVDFDSDGWDDFYTVTSKEDGHNALYRNLGNGAFEDVAQRVGLSNLNQAATGVSTGAVWGDYDNDGFEDVFLYKWGRPILLHNEAGKRFTDVSDGTPLPRWANINTAIWLDYDNDGKLDLFAAGYYPEDVNLWHLKTTRMMPDSFEYAQNGGRRYLFHNLGDGKFEEVSEKMGLSSRRWALAAVAADLRGTGHPDIFVANDYGVSELFVNDGGKRFRETGKQAGVGFSPKSGMTASVGDVLNQGQFAVYVSNISEEGVLVQGNNLWVPKPGSRGAAISYENMANTFGVELAGWSFGAQFADLNNDGFNDLYVTTGNVSLDPHRSYWYDYSKVAGGNSTIISDAANWPPLNGRSLSGYQQKRVWLNDGEGRFQEVAQMVGATDVYDGRSVATADFENKGSLDVVVANQRGPLLLYKNQVAPHRHWVELKLEGTKSNRSAIGATVRVLWSGQEQLQQVSGGSGFCAQNQRKLHFGLGNASAVDRIEIRWPAGEKQVLTAPAIDRVVFVKEPQ